jgi:radical SAM superfamily enzyme YgiQ (UPF0313 family)
MIVIVRPNARIQYNKLEEIRAIEPPIWHTILADYYKAKVIIDAELENYTIEETVEKILSYKPKKVIILATGSHPSAFIQQRDGMNKIEKLLGGNIETITLDHLPKSPVKYKAKYDLIDIERYKCHNWHSWTNNCNVQPYGTIYTSISCPFKCEFCTIHQFYGRTFEQRPIEDVYKDLDYFAFHRIKNIKIMDELFIFNPNRAMLICDYIIKKEYDFNIWAYARIDIMAPQLLEKMRKAGIRWLAYGIETGNEQIRKNVLKGRFDNNKIREVVKMTKDYDIAVLGNYMFGFWEDTIDTMQETLDFALELQCEYNNLYCVVAYPDSLLYNSMKEKGVDLPVSWDEYGQFSKSFKPLPTKTLSGNKVLKFRDYAFNTLFNDPIYLSMMENKFGEDVLKDILKMTRIKIR